MAKRNVGNKKKIPGKNHHHLLQQSFLSLDSYPPFSPTCLQNFSSQRNWKIFNRKMDSHNLLSNFWCKKLFSPFLSNRLALCLSISTYTSPQPLQLHTPSHLLTQPKFDSLDIFEMELPSSEVSQVMFNLTRDYSSRRCFLLKYSLCRRPDIALSEAKRVSIHTF